jgi:hypothetical protein
MGGKGEIREERHHATKEKGGLCSLLFLGSSPLLHGFGWRSSRLGDASRLGLANDLGLFNDGRGL